MEEQIAFRYPKRASATQEELAARRRQSPAHSRRTGSSSDHATYATEVDDTPDSYYDTRMPTSARRYTTANGEQVITQGKRRIVIHPEPPPKQKRHIHWLLWVGIGMFIMLLGWFLLTMLQTWWTDQQNTWSYGYPRTYQTDAVVGHSDSADHPSHFIAINLNGHVEVIEFPGGDATHAKIYIGPPLIGDNASLIPVTVSFKDVNGDGKPDMLIHVQDQTLVFLNTGRQFQSPKQ
jgi:hypothetical protein